MPITFHGARLIDATGERLNATITIDGGRIVAGEQGDASPARIDAHDLIVMPGFIDVHTHGGGGFNLHTTDAREIDEYARWAPSTGTTGFLAGLVGVPHGLPEMQLAAVIAAGNKDQPAAELLGVHLEGPYMNPQWRGAHDPSWLRMPMERETERLLELTGDRLKLITLAPELPNADVMIRRLIAAGVTVSIGHTDATYAQTQAAIAWGATHMTHCFNAMRSLHHRDPGPIGALIEAEGVRGEVIADGVHVHPAVFRLLVRALGPERTIIITDALPAAGVPEACFTFGGQEARVVDGVARLMDGTITGSVLTLDQALRNIVKFAGVPLHEAVGMLTINPARSAGVAHRKGLLQPGYDADLLIFDRDLTLQATLCRGRLAYATPSWSARSNVLTASTSAR